jgi:hypothetical protein
MSLPFHLPLWILALVFVYLLPQAAKAYKRHRQLLWLRCPENQLDVLVQLRRGPDAAGETALPVTDCSRWPGRRACAQGCVLHGAPLPGRGAGDAPAAGA